MEFQKIETELMKNSLDYDDDTPKRYSDAIIEDEKIEIDLSGDDRNKKAAFMGSVPENQLDSP